MQRLAISEDDQKKRQAALVEAIVAFITSQTGAKVAGWAPHVFLCEGAVLVTSTRTAPFVSPIRVELANKDNPVGANLDYSKRIEELGRMSGAWARHSRAPRTS